MYIFWRGRGWWVTWIALFAMVIPMIVAHQIDGPAVDKGVSIAMALAAAVTFGLGLRFNRGNGAGGPARHSFWGLPFQFWAVPMLAFSLLLGSGMMTTAEEPRPHSAYAPSANGGAK